MLTFLYWLLQFHNWVWVFCILFKKKSNFKLKVNDTAPVKLSLFSQGFQTRDRVMWFHSNSVSACLKRVTGCSQEESNALRQPVVIAWNREGCQNISWDWGNLILFGKKSLIFILDLVAKPSCFFHVFFSLLKSNLNSFFLPDFLI